MNTTAHSKQAIHNERFLKDLLQGNTPYRDWVITVTFYTALHYVHAYFANIGIANKKRKNHSLVIGLVRARLTCISNDYYLLYEECRRVRYYQKYQKRISHSHINYYLSLFRTIKSHLQSLLGNTLIPRLR
ncbi:hypothetical protein [Candidatus Borrarchaeum sp.]|uniref:hypothetical protein n=1 Tax=Candidatus Borrarchaeum sp. TaxID=2846742 RepID=UPI00257D466B|nr:hypothetical protein [Candidatus Borrarchaeum sp.]